MRRHLDLPRYLWERSLARTLPFRTVRRARVGSTELVEIRRWAQTTQRPQLTVCIPIRDRLDLLLPCLLSLARTCCGVPVEVVIGDTGSRPETLMTLQDIGVRVVTVPGSFNFSRACNAMAAGSRAGRLLFLNSDTEALKSGWAESVLGAEEDEVLGATLLYPGTRRVQHIGVKPVHGPRWPAPNAYRPPRRLRDGKGWALQNVGLGRSLDRLPTRPTDVMAVAGAFLSLAASRFATLRGFDESFTVDLQDIDLCLRARRAGMRVRWRPEIRFAHQHAASRGRYAFPSEDWVRFLGRWEGELSLWAERG